MLDIEPTIIAGVIALLSYAAEQVRITGADWPDGYISPEPVCGWVAKVGLPWEVMLHMHLAKALKGIVENDS